MPATIIEMSAATPWTMSWREWKQVAVRTWQESSDDNVGLVSAGVAFYGFLALVPLLGAIVLSYGLVAEPSTVMRNMEQLTSVMPADAAKLIGAQLLNVVETSGGKKGVGLLLALGLALFGARNAAGAIVTALNIAYEEQEKRSFVRLNLLALTITAAGVAIAVLAMIAIAALGHLEELTPRVPDWLTVIGKIASYALLATAGAFGAATLYRYGPSRQKARWVWLTPGSLFAAVMWLLLTLGFGIYVANFGNYNATYGSLGTVVVLLTWLYLSSYILLFGAELNAEFEHQTSDDSTDGLPQPVGERGAWVADNVVGAPEVESDLPMPASDAQGVGDEPSTDNAQIAKYYASGRVAARATQFAGIGKVGILTSGIAAFGFAKIRRGARPAIGLALVAAAGGLAWLSRERDKPGIAPLTVSHEGIDPEAVKSL